ncbi:MAG: DEAD/DEAH box helicase [Deltaproteobacteria bacterium]|nr:DEAD/DEAH box helicase [Deltaproteobacteria bacterium]
MPETVTDAESQDLPEEEVVAQAEAIEEVKENSEVTDVETAEAVKTDDDSAPEAQAATEDSEAQTTDEEAPVARNGLIFSERPFSDFPIGDKLKEALAEMKYEYPTDVQEEVIDAALKGSDLVVQAKTGSGKTLGFGLPILERFEPGCGEPCKPKVLVLTPTRELAHQVAQEFRRVGEANGNKIFAVYGGVPLSRQVGALKSGIDILIATPGRLLDHIRRKNVSLEGIQTAVLDEADEMLSMGFWDDVTSLLEQCPEGRQVMLFSATLPYQIAKAAAHYLKDPVRVDVSGDVLTVDGIDNTIFHVLPDLPKPRQLLYLLEEERPSSAIVFCNTRNETEVIAKYLCQNGFVAEALSGSFRQRERERVMGRIKSGALRYMVATDIAARGIDIEHLSHVYNYSLPEFSEVYLHRVGRTGRAGRSGKAVSLVDGKGLGTYTVLERKFNVKFTEVELPNEEIVLRKRSERIMKDLLDKASVAETSQHRPAAEDIIKNEDSAEIVAFLLKSYFGQQAADATKSGNGPRPQKRDRNPDENREARGENGGDDDDGRSRRRRRRRGGREDGGERNDRNDRNDRGGRGGRDRKPRGERNEQAASGGGETATAPAEDGMRHLKVNIGFDDGFKGRGAIAKKITSLAGLNDGIVSEIESKRNHAVLKTTPEVADLLVERVDGAQIGKKILSVSIA